MYRYQKSDEDEEIGYTAKASSWEAVKDVLTQIFNFKKLRSPTILSGGIVAWEVLIFCKCRKQWYFVLLLEIL
jgi:hypothetical protein